MHLENSHAAGTEIESIYHGAYLNRGSLLEALRSATMPQHQKIEANKNMSRLMADDFQLGEYLDLLLRFYGFYRGIEPWLYSSQPGLLAEFNYRTRSDLLQSDLQSLNSEINLDSIVRLELGRDALQEYWFVFGCLYVIEGSSLGAQIIRKKLLANFGSRVERSIAFFSGPQPVEKAGWKGFKNKADNNFLLSGSVVDMESAIRGAAFTFELLDNWLDRGTA